MVDHQTRMKGADLENNGRRGSFPKNTNCFTFIRSFSTLPASGLERKTIDMINMFMVSGLRSGLMLHMLNMRPE